LGDLAVNFIEKLLLLFSFVCGMTKHIQAACQRSGWQTHAFIVDSGQVELRFLIGLNYHEMQISL